jgi:hypothetical protein
VVIAREDQPGDLRLVAYYTGSPAKDLRAALQARLPAQMMPAHFVPLAQMPLTPNAKIDRKALPAPNAARVAKPDVALPIPISTGDTQSHIAAVWQQVLGVPQVGPTDNFFSLGGHSLLAVQAHRTLRDRLNIPGLSITDLFRFPVLGDLARHLNGKLAPTLVTPLVTDQPEPSASLRMDAMARRRAMRADRGAK